MKEFDYKVEIFVMQGNQKRRFSTVEISALNKEIAIKKNN